jgi:hypothetical protein
MTNLVVDLVTLFTHRLTAEVGRERAELSVIDRDQGPVDDYCQLHS